MPVIGSIADDLTGATTTGVLLARSKARTGVFFDVDAARKAESAANLDAIIISSNSRPLPPNEAYDIVKKGTQALCGMGVKYFQKRIDTTCRGGIGVEIDAMLDVLGGDTVAIVVPAMPQSRRILAGGFSVIDGTALIKTPVAQDVRTPVTESYIPRLLSGQTRRKVGLVTLDIVLKGNQAIKERMTELRAKENCEVIVVDAITIEDVGQIAQAAIATNWDFITVGPGPFTAQTAFNRSLISIEEPNIPPEGDENGKTILVMAGSATSVTKKQMEVLCEDPRHVRISVNPELLIDGYDTAEKEVVRAAEEALSYIMSDNQPRAILFETALHGALLNLSEEEQKRHLAPGKAAGTRVVTSVLAPMEIVESSLQIS